MSNRFQIVFMTAASIDEASRIAEALVKEELAACVNLVETVQSIYRWKGQLVKDSEVLLLAKTTRDKFDSLQARVTALHSYEVPEIVAVELESISPGYRRFLEDILGE
jgi:periplasmic divalent cation tolerance protein